VTTRNPRLDPQVDDEFETRNGGIYIVVERTKLLWIFPMVRLWEARTDTSYWCRLKDFQDWASDNYIKVTPHDE
jgi:hypothetical protein